MSKWTVVGGLLCLGGLVLFGFQVISGLVGQSAEWESLAIYDIIDPEKLAWMDSITWLGIDRGLDYLASSPIYIIMLVVGAVCLLISGFVKN